MSRARLLAMPNSHAVSLARRRLERCVLLDHEYGHQVNERGAGLLRRSTFAAYLDLREAGLGAEADLILRQGSAS